MKNGFVYIVIFLSLCLPYLSGAVESFSLLPDDSNKPEFKHLIPLLDENNKRITSSDKPARPFSTRNTCSNICHDYSKISQGWHFNATDTNLPTARQGQPWLFNEPNTATMIPLSYRQWPATINPPMLNISPVKFTSLFAPMTPGGNLLKTGDVLSKTEINCLACHDSSASYDQNQFVNQIKKQNYQYAATAACSFAHVTDLDQPTVTYDNNAFDMLNFVYFDVSKKIPDRNCQFCHTTGIVDADTGKTEDYQDAHLLAGLNCVDCHKNDINHNITRGYPDERFCSTNPYASVVACESCHLPETAQQKEYADFFGSSTPKHLGIPPLHFEKLTCTACHSGPMPAEKTYIVQTSRTHQIDYNEPRPNSRNTTVIFSPVYAKQADGKIAPHNTFWPAYWAAVENNNITALPLDKLTSVSMNLAGEENNSKLTLDQIKTILEYLRPSVSPQAQPAYIAGRNIYRLDHQNDLITADNTISNPCLWPIAHNLRKTENSLGAKDCSDCHSTDSPFYFGRVQIASTVISDQDQYVTMLNFQNADPLFTRLFAASFIFRPWLKLIMVITCLVLAAVLILYFFKALNRIADILAKDEK